jgi:hypothetical protein
MLIVFLAGGKELESMVFSGSGFDRTIFLRRFRRWK